MVVELVVEPVSVVDVEFVPEVVEFASVIEFVASEPLEFASEAPGLAVSGSFWILIWKLSWDFSLFWVGFSLESVSLWAFLVTSRRTIFVVSGWKISFVSDLTLRTKFGSCFLIISWISLNSFVSSKAFLKIDYH